VGSPLAAGVVAAAKIYGSAGSFSPAPAAEDDTASSARPRAARARPRSSNTGDRLECRDCASPVSHAHSRSRRVRDAAPVEHQRQGRGSPLVERLELETRCLLYGLRFADVDLAHDASISAFTSVQSFQSPDTARQSAGATGFALFHERRSPFATSGEVQTIGSLRDEPVNARQSADLENRAQQRVTGMAISPFRRAGAR